VIAMLKAAALSNALIDWQSLAATLNATGFIAIAQPQVRLKYYQIHCVVTDNNEVREYFNFIKQMIR